ncbi:MAG: hypothetical protein ACK493_14295 [Planctomycetota bacterium]|jgi:hypothetical protein|nr:hypothetical protein [Blastopirellula sp.]
METTLHRQLKLAFAGPKSKFEQRLGRYRIDVVTGRRLIEIQHSSLAAIWRKCAELLERKHRLDIIKPLVVRKRLVKLTGPGGQIVDQRWSPYRGTIFDIFEELLYFRRVFPHPQLRLIVPLLDVEEIRFPGHGRRRRWRQNDFQVADRSYTTWHGCEVFERAEDLLRLLPPELPPVWDTGLLARQAGVSRGVAQRVAYVLREIGAVCQQGKRGNAWLYQQTEVAAPRPRRRKKAQPLP